MSDRDKLDDMLFGEIGKCSEKLEELGKIVHTHSGILQGQNIIIGVIVVAILGLAFGIITDWTKTKQIQVAQEKVIVSKEVTK